MNIVQCDVDLIPIFKELIVVDMCKDDICEMIRMRFGDKLAKLVEYKLNEIPREDFAACLSESDKEGISEQDTQE